MVAVVCKVVSEFLSVCHAEKLRIAKLCEVCSPQASTEPGSAAVHSKRFFRLPYYSFISCIVTLVLGCAQAAVPASL